MRRAQITNRIRSLTHLLWLLYWLAPAKIADANETTNLALVDSIQFRMSTPSETAHIHQAAESALNLAKQRLSRELHGKSWLQYLQIDGIDQSIRSLPKMLPDSNTKQDLTSGESSRFDHPVEFLARTLPRFYGITPGLEMTELVQLRQRISELVPVYRLRQNADKLRTELEQRKKAVRAIFVSSATEREQVRLLMPHLSWFRRYRQADELLRVFENQAHPNLILHVDSRGLATWSQQSISRVIPFQEKIDGRSVQGTAQLVGTALLVPLKSPHFFAGRLQLDAHLDVSLSGQQRRLQFHLQSSAEAMGHQTLSLIEGKIRQHPPQALATAALNSATVCTPRQGPISRLVRRGGLRLIEKQQNNIQDSIARAVEDALSEELQTEVSQRVSALETDVVSKLRLNALRMGISLDGLTSSSSDSRSSLFAIVGKDAGLAAPRNPPVNGSSEQAQLQIHQSVFNLLFYRTLAGREVADLRKTLAEFGIFLNEQGDTGDAGNGIMGITFSEDTPMTVNLVNASDGDCLLELRLSGTSYRFDQYRLSAMDFMARFRLKTQSGQVSLIREGPVEVLPPPSGSSLRFIQQRQIISKRLQALFPNTQQFPLSRLWADLTGKDLSHAVQVKANEGWLTLSIR